MGWRIALGAAVLAVVYIAVFRQPEPGARQPSVEGTTLRLDYRLNAQPRLK
jgi:hypothetical protein